MKIAELKGKNVVIKLPIDVLVTAFNFNPNNYSDEIKVKYKRQFAKGVAELINNHSVDSESGLTVFEDFLDSIFEEMIESDASYIKFPKDE